VKNTINMKEEKQMEQKQTKTDIQKLWKREGHSDALNQKEKAFSDFIDKEDNRAKDQEYVT